MLFGFVSALIAGYLLGNVRKHYLISVFSLWLCGRVVEVFSTNVMLINLSYSAFGLIIAFNIAPKFLVAKKWRNRVMAPLIATIGCFPLVSWVLENSTYSVDLYPHNFVLLISLLMFFMGGRLITPAATRAFADMGIKIPHRVQPKIEAATIVLLLLACLLSVSVSLRQYAGVLSGFAAVLILLRLYRWGIHRLKHRFMDIWALAVGYAWLGLGLLIFSLSLIVNQPVASSLHIITIGGVGTLSTSVILRTMAKHKQAAKAIYIACIILISIAVLCRFSIHILPSWWLVLINITALCWSINYLIVLIYCFKCLSNNHTRF